jgi:uncharacterized membrane protein YcjF (UPF0283 family)
MAFNWLLGVALIVLGIGVIDKGRALAPIPSQEVSFGEYAPVVGSVVILFGVWVIALECRRIWQLRQSENGQSKKD